MKKYKIFRKRYPKFLFENFSYKISKNLEIVFHFRIDPDIKFEPKIVIKNINQKRVRKLNKKILENLIFHLGMAEIPSYWKATCSAKIEILAGFLNKEQIRWWKELILKGMGQFFFENKINFTRPNFLKISSFFHDREKMKIKVFFGKLAENKVLVPIGGGKDSIVTLEILKKTKKKLNCFLLNPAKFAKKVIKIAGFKKPIIVERKIDKKLLELNKKGFLNGHTPFTAYLSFLSCLLAVLFDFKFIAFSLEKSANEGNLKYLGKIINHQYSKTSQFERKFRNFAKKYLAKDIEYLSILRPFSELEISKMFTKYPQYFLAFSSCNKGQKLGKRWCLSCPKCLFLYASLYPHLDKKVILKIFGKDLFEKKELLPIMKSLIEKEKPKPFECVGTKKESFLAFYQSLKKAKRVGERPFLLKYFEEKILPPLLDRYPISVV